MRPPDVVARELAREWLANMDPTRNRSRSLRCFAQGLASLCEPGA